MSDADRRWLEELWSNYASRIFAYAARRVGQQHADDVVSDVFVVAWRQRKQRPRKELPWLYGVARRVLADRFRAESRWERLIERAGNQPRLEEPLDDDVADRLRLAAALDKLAEPDREALLLTAWEGLKPSEAAVALAMTASAFRMRLTRARRRFRSALAENTGADIAAERSKRGGQRAK